MKKNGHFFCLLTILLSGVLCAADEFPIAAAKSRVVMARNPKAINERNQANQQETTRLFDSALTALTGEKSAADSWRALGLRPEDTVAVKINCNTWTIDLSPHPELVNALCRSLQAVVPANRIIIYDNESAAMEKSGFAINRSENGVRRTGTDQGDGFDPQERLTTIVTRHASKIINLASLKCAEGDLIASLLFKNHIGSLIPEDMPKCHNSHEFLAGVSARPSIKNKTILNIIAGLRGTYRRGVPWYWAGIILGTDPAAAEITAIDVMNAKRAAEKVPALPIPEYLKLAEAQFDLGTMDHDYFELVRLDL